MPSPRRAFPYFKVQVFDQRSVTWREKKVGFDTFEEAKRFIDNLPAEERVRIVRVEEDGYHEVDDDS